MLHLRIPKILKPTLDKLDLCSLPPIPLHFLSPGKGQLAQVLALHLTPFQQTVAKVDSAVTHSNSMSSMHDQIPPKQLSWAEPRPLAYGISHMAVITEEEGRRRLD